MLELIKHDTKSLKNPIHGNHLKL